MKATYRFTEEDERQIQAFARARNDHKVRAGIASKKYDDSKSEREAHEKGLRGELAAARLLGLSVDHRLRRSGDGGADLKFECGVTCEVRYRTERGYDFALGSPSVASLEADVGVLMWPARRSGGAELVGWTSRVHVALRGKTKNYGHGDRLVVEPKDLLSPSSLFSLIRD